MPSVYIHTYGSKHRYVCH